MVDRIGHILDIPGISDLELNYPEHFEDMSVNTLKALLKAKGKKCSGCAVRYRDFFKMGEFTDKANRRRSIDLAKETIDVIRSLEGNCLSIWLAYDGFDHPFQIDYPAAWAAIAESIGEIADYAGTVQVSIEFKPREPRSFSMVPNTGHTLRMIDRIARPNVGMTLDYCHSLMAAESPAMSIALAASEGKLFGVHLNDGYGLGDDGLFFGSVNQLRALEFMYYLKRYRYEGLIYFDTFPVREDPSEETEMNIWMVNTLSARIDSFGIDAIGTLLRDSGGFKSRKSILDLLIGTR